jgi:hypothetical protein
MEVIDHIHIEFIAPPSKAVYNILINTVKSVHGDHLY